MINAIQAREKSKQRLNEIVTSQLQEIEGLVLEACEKGDFNTYYNLALREETKKFLVDSGYTLKNEGDNNIIAWKNIETTDNQDQEEDLSINNDNVDSVPESDVESENKETPDRPNSDSFTFEEFYDENSSEKVE